jgi:hypothetical protein
MEKLVYCALRICCFVGTTFVVVHGDYRSRCTAYCSYGNKDVGNFDCLDKSRNFSCSSSPVYCCGNANFKYCCCDEAKWVQLLEYNCDGFSFVEYYRWIIIICALAALFIVLLGVVFAVCRYGRHCRTGTSDAGNDSESVNVENRLRDFDPGSETAFQPPAYETLQKDPPLYDNIFGPTTSYENASFTPDEVGAVNEGPPDTETRPLNTGVGISIIASSGQLSNPAETDKTM